MREVERIERVIREQGNISPDVIAYYDRRINYFVYNSYRIAIPFNLNPEEREAVIRQRVFMLDDAQDEITRQHLLSRWNNELQYEIMNSNLSDYVTSTSSTYSSDWGTTIDYTVNNPFFGITFQDETVVEPKTKEELNKYYNKK